MRADVADLRSIVAEYIHETMGWMQGVSRMNGWLLCDFGGIAEYTPMGKDSL